MLLLLLGAASAAPPPLELAEDAFRVSRTELCMPSGLRIVYQHEPEHPTVTWTTVIGAGSTSDPEGGEGLAHVVEHLWFRSTPSGSDLWSHAAELGADLNGITRPDDTTYPTVAPAKALPQLLALESARLTDPLQGVTPEVFDTEREVVRSELRWRFENHSTIGYLALLEQVFPAGHPYHRPTIGTHDSLDALSLDDAASFVGDHYVPANATWVITAPQSVQAFRELLASHAAEALFEGASGCPTAQQTKPSTPGAPPSAEPIDVEALVPSPVALVAWSLPAGVGDDRATIQRVTTEIEDALWRWGVTCTSQPMLRATLVDCQIPLPTDVARRPDEREAYVRDVLDHVYEAWVHEAPVILDWKYSQARADQLGWLFDQVETLPSTHADARFIHHTGRLDWLPSTLMQIVESGRTADNRFAQQWFDQKRAATVFLVPRTDGVGGSSRHASSAIEVPDDLEVDAAQIRSEAVELDLSELREETLDNGLRVQVLPHGSAPFVRVHLVFDGGPALAPEPELHLLRRVYLESLDGVIQNVPLEEAPLRVGGDWIDGGTAVTTEYGLRGASGNLEQLLYLLRERLDNMRVKVEQRQAIRDAIEDVMWEERDVASTWAAITHEQHLTGAHTWWDPATIDEQARTKPAAVQAWHRAIVRPTDATLVIVGRVDPDEAIDHARTWLGTLKDRSDGAPHAPRLSAHEPPARQVQALDDPARAGADIHLSCVLGEPTLASLETRRLTTAILGQLANTRLREELGVTYGVQAWTELLPTGRVGLHLDADVVADATGPAVQTLLDGIDALADGGLVPAALDRTKLELARRSALGLRDSQQIAERLLDARRSGHGTERLTDATDRLVAVGVDDIADQLAACAGHEVVTVQGALDPVRASLDEVGVDVEVLDWQAARDAAMKEHDPKRFKQRQRDAARSD